MGDTPQAAGLSRKVKVRSLGDLDGRTAPAKRARALAADIISDLGGDDNISAGERELVTRVSVLATVCQDAEVALLTGEEVDLQLHLAAVNALRRVLSTLGLERRAKDVTPTLDVYLKQKRAEADDIEVEP